MEKHYYVYIMTIKIHTVLYTDITNDIIRRVYEHKEKLFKGFTYKYNVNKLVYYEIHNNVRDAIAREKQIKSVSRNIKGCNPRISARSAKIRVQFISKWRFQ